MQVRWVLTQFHTDVAGFDAPVAGDYGGQWYCPVHPSTTDGWALAQIYVNAHQIEAMSADSRIVVCPLSFDPRPIPTQVQTTYSAQGATSDMSISALIATLADTEPRYGHQI
jgi:hypothetical protein